MRSLVGAFLELRVHSMHSNEPDECLLGKVRSIEGGYFVFLYSFFPFSLAVVCEIKKIGENPFLYHQRDDCGQPCAYRCRCVLIRWQG